MKKARDNAPHKRRAEEGDVRVGQLIRTQRVSKGLSQTELAEKIGVTFQQVQKYEKGVNRVSAGRLERVAAALDVPINFFFGGSGGETLKSGALENLTLIKSAGMVDLMRAFGKIKDRDVRQSIIKIAEAAARN